MKLTAELIHRAATDGSGFKADQLRLLGVAWPPKQGWIQKLEGMEIAEETWRVVLRLAGHKNKRTRAEICDSITTPSLFG